MANNTLGEYKESLELFLKNYKTFINRNYYHSGELTTELQRRIPLISGIVHTVHGGGSLKIESKTINFRQALGYSLSGNISGDQRRFMENEIELTLNEAIGNIINGTIPHREIEPLLPIKNDTLEERCSDLLNAPGNFDRVIREATLILEDKLRTSVPHEKLCELIPLAKEQVGEPLANKLLSPNNPVIVVSDKHQERIAFHKMVVGIISYLRNPSHHSLNDDTEWSLAWSVVGIIDSILSELDDSYISGEKPKT
ncbi:TIGR02391 family protein [Chloroflexota bacterium]